MTGQQPQDESSAAAPRRGRGRPPGKPDTRGAILAAALEEFTEKGYDAASLRAIARRAGVDAALVHHYFAGKRELFLATLETHIDPNEVKAYLTAGGIEQLGYRMVHVATTVWESPVGHSIAALLRSQPGSYPMLAQFMMAELVRKVLAAVDFTGRDVEERIALVQMQMAGLLTARYVVRIEPAASLPLDVVRRRMGAQVQRLLTGSLEHLPTSADAAHKTIDNPSASSGMRSSVWSTRVRQQEAWKGSDKGSGGRATES